VVTGGVRELADTAAVDVRCDVVVGLCHDDP
jgi:hypothetical protein